MHFKIQDSYGSKKPIPLEGRNKGDLLIMEMLHYHMKSKTTLIRELKEMYASKKKEIVARLKEFRRHWSENIDEEIFKELAFCILTPQSKAKACWAAVEGLYRQGLIEKGNAAQIKQKLRNVRFHNKKATYLVKARELFLDNGKFSIKPALNSITDIRECREWLVRNITGLGYKEASHFLRNIGLGKHIAILDRHILRNLYLYGVIKAIPESMSRTKYLQIEHKMKDFAEKTGIPLSHLDLLLWYKETGEIFK